MLSFAEIFSNSKSEGRGDAMERKSERRNEFLRRERERGANFFIIAVATRTNLSCVHETMAENE